MNSMVNKKIYILIENNYIKISPMKQI